MKKHLIATTLLILNFLSSQAQVNMPPKNAQQALNKVDRHFFIENKGQWPSEVLYFTQMNGLNTWITTKGMLYEFYKTEEIISAAILGKENKNSQVIPDKFEHREYKRWGHRVSYTLIGNNTEVKPEGKQKQITYYNYFLGNDPSKHAANVGLYQEAIVKEVYIGIDMRYYFDKGLLRYDYIVHPGADPSQIKFNLEGSEKTYLNEKGELIFTTCFGVVKNADLYCYQVEDKKSVAAKFKKQDENWSIDIGAYNKTQTLIIDPLIYSTFIGGTTFEFPGSIALDVSNNAFITGKTRSVDYDVTLGAFQTIYVGGGLGDEVFVSKLNSTGTALLYSTFIGGNDDESGSSLALDALGNAYITGITSSTNYPTTVGAFQISNIGYTDVFVTKLNPTGNVLIYSTYIGGIGYDGGSSIALDGSDNAYITGSAGPSNYPTTPGAFYNINAGSSDVFVTKLNTNGTALIYSAIIGGNSSDDASSIALDASGNAYITGSSGSNNYPITAGAFQPVNAGADVIVTKLNSTGTALIYSTFIGGSNGVDSGNSIALDALGNAYITGNSWSTDFPVTAGVFQPANAGGLDAFVSKLNSSGTALIYSTYIGGSPNVDAAYSIKLDALDNAYITGYTWNTDYPVTAGASQTIIAGDSDIFLTKLNASGTTLMYSSYMGGSTTESGYEIALDASENIYITGYTSSTNYSITPGAFQTVHAGSTDVFVTKLSICNQGSINLSSTPGTANQTLCVNSAITNITYSTSGATGATFNGLPPGVTGNWINNVCTISGTASLPGVYNYSVDLVGACSSPTTGVISVNICASISENSKDYLFNIYPNPTCSNFIIELNKPCVIFIYNSLGQIIYEEKLLQLKSEISFADFAKGMYFVRIGTEVQKIIKE